MFKRLLNYLFYVYEIKLSHYIAMIINYMIMIINVFNYC